MVKRLSIYSRIKNKLSAAISNIKRKNTEDILNEDIRLLSADKKELDKRRYQLEERRYKLERRESKVLNTLSKRLKRLEDEKRGVFDFVVSKEDLDVNLDKVRYIIETVNPISKENLEKIVERSELLEWEQRIKGLREDVAKLNNSKNILGISEAKLEAIKEIAEMVESIRTMKKSGRDIPKTDLLERIRLIIDLAMIYSGQSLPDQTIHKNREELEKLIFGEALKNREELKPLNINLNYQNGIAFLKEGKFNEAKKCFEKITEVNPDLKGAWLNRGYSAGRLGDVGTEIDCYNMALKIDKDYKLAKYNLKIAKREMKRTR